MTVTKNGQEYVFDPEKNTESASNKALKKARKRGTLARNKRLMLKSLIQYRQRHNEWPTAKQAFTHLAENNEHVNPFNQSSYQPRLTDELPSMKMVEEAGTRNDRVTWKPTQKGLQALAKVENRG